PAIVRQRCLTKRRKAQFFVVSESGAGRSLHSHSSFGSCLGPHALAAKITPRRSRIPLSWPRNRLTHIGRFHQVSSKLADPFVGGVVVSVKQNVSKTAIPLEISSMGVGVANHTLTSPSITCCSARPSAPVMPAATVVLDWTLS